MHNLALQVDESDEFKVVDLDQNTPQWLDFRRHCIGASDIPIIMGMFPGKNQYTLWLIKTGRKSEGVAGYLAERGQRLEPAARELAEKHFNTTFESPVVYRKDTPWALASLDGIDPTKTVLIEIKCPSFANYEKIKSGEIPEAYVAQCHWQMYVTGANSVHLFAYSGEEYTVHEIKRNHLLIDQIVEAAEQFIYYVDNDVEPPRDITSHMLIDDEAFLATEALYAQKKALLDVVKKEVDEIRRELLDLTDGGNCEGSSVKITWSNPESSIDYKAVVEHLGVDQEILKRFAKVKASYPTVTVKKSS